MNEEIIEGEFLTPIPRKPGESITMDFSDAIRHLTKGKKIRRMEWPDEDYALLKDEWLTVYTKGGFHTWLVSLGDLDAQDWYVVKEDNATN